MGKWSEISKTLPRREEEPGVFREKVNTFKDAQRVKTLDDLTFALRSKRPGDKVEVILLRDGKEISTEATLEQRR